MLASLAKAGKAPVSADQALSFSQQIGALAYVETSAVKAGRGIEAAFEAGCLAATGQLSGARAGPAHAHFHTPSPPRAHSSAAQRYSRASNSTSTSPADSLERSGDNLYKLEPTEQFWDQFSHFTPTKNGVHHQHHMQQQHQQHPAIHHAKSPSLGSAASGPASRSASLSSKTRSSTSIPSISSYGSSLSKTPKSGRRSLSSNGVNGKGKENASAANNGENMITIKCQRLTADKTYEEIEVEVPAPIYETIQFYNADSPANGGALGGRSAKERRSFGHKLRNLFTGGKN